MLPSSGSIWKLLLLPHEVNKGGHFPGQVVGLHSPCYSIFVKMVMPMSLVNIKIQRRPKYFKSFFLPQTIPSYNLFSIRDWMSKIWPKLLIVEVQGTGLEGLLIEYIACYCFYGQAIRNETSHWCFCRGFLVVVI